MMINQHAGRPVRVLRTEATAPFELSNEGNVMALLPNTLDMYRNGDLNHGLPQLGQVAGRIRAIQPVADIIRETVAEFESVVGGLASQYLGR